MNIDLDLLRPSTLAALAAILSMEASEADALADAGLGNHGTVDYLVTAAAEAHSALIANVGEDDALVMLLEAGAHPDYLDL